MAETLNPSLTAAWFGKPCPVCHRLMDARRPPKKYLPPTDAAVNFRVMCGECTRKQ